MTFNKIWTGAKWWKFDFHTHTPASNDYPTKTDTPEDWLLAYMKAGIDCVAITDHNTGDWVDRLKQAYLTMEQSNPSGFRELSIFPGVEISVNNGIHVLAILPLETSTSDIASLLGAVGFRGTKGTSDSVTEKPIDEVVSEISKSMGIAIPAHVDQPKGLFSAINGTTLENVMRNPSIFAIETIDLNNAKPPLYAQRKIKWTDVLGSDSHKLNYDSDSVLPYPGIRFTWVKMEQPSIEGLRLALIDGQLSIRRSDQFASDQNIHSNMMIEKIVIDNAKYLGRGEKLTIRFNPWLNAIIGGRGTGKSTIIEFLRKVLGRESEIPEALGMEHEKYTLVHSRDQDGLLLANTVLNVRYWKDEAQYRIAFQKDNENFTLEKFVDDNWEPDEGDISGRFPIRIYSQKQIFDMTRNTQGLLDIIDDAPEVGYSNWEREFSSLKDKFLDERSRFRSTVVTDEEKRSINGQISDVKQKLSVFNKKGNSEKLSSYGVLQKQLNELHAFETGLTELSDIISEFEQSIECPAIDESLFASDAEGLEVVSAYYEAKESINGVISSIEASADSVNVVAKLWKEKYSALPFNQRRLQIESSYHETIVEMESAGITNLSEHTELLARMQFLEGEKTKLDRRSNDLLRLKKLCNLTCKEIHPFREKLTAQRQLFLDNVLSNNEFVKITVVPYGCVAESPETIREILFSSTDLFDRDMNPDNEGGMMYSLVNGDGTALKRIHRFKQMIMDVYENKQGGSYSAKDKRFAARIQELPASIIDGLLCWYPEDSLKIEFKARGRDFVPLETGSPGQRTAVLLAFILSYGDEPLVLDQPEDDIDNHMIYSLIVESLRSNKIRRQVIVVTHNANIVVNGDAENVITLHVPNGRTEIKSQGSLQRIDVRNSVCDVLEGGREAFARRYKRINIQQ
ncbi:MAG: AAA family ATPase [Candidatus Cloacimonetes bacterium]|jgi:energy-coupling factor transporter ATP-binding protein EcfA2/histidinol phosphatase-like PHP family hydrolase|nr:AAA family ATPase [Candidatus Cloacimonadota bacterium]MDY0326198.1 AAA family ATPase [Candidatus Cloacimonadaceae bacterium]